MTEIEIVAKLDGFKGETRPIRDPREESRIRNNFSGDAALLEWSRYLTRIMLTHIKATTPTDEEFLNSQKEKYEVERYTADDWQDWKIIEDLREDEIY